jgi:polyisoprenoid-binding protein YceI
MKFNRFYISLLLTTVFFVASSKLVFSQSIDQSASQVSFEVDNMSVNTVEGTFGGMTGKVKFDPAHPDKAKFDVCVDAASIDTDINKRDKHLRSEDYLHVEKYPNICFKSISVQKSGAGYIAKGYLILHGVSKLIELPFTYQNGRFEGNITINRFEYDIAEDTGTFMMGEEIEVDIVCVLK